MEQNERNKNLSLKKKLFISHGIIIATAAVIAVLLLVGLNIVKGNVSGIFNGPLANIDSVGKVRYGITDLQRAINRILTEDSSQVGNSYVNFEKTVTEDVSLITDSVQQMQNRKMNTESTALLNQIASKIDEGEKVRSTLMTQIKAGRYSEAVELNNNTYLPIVNDIKSLSEQLENSIDKTAVNYYTMSKYTGVGMTVAGILLLIADVVFGLRVTRKMASAIVEPVQEITEAAKIMYSGDMSVGERITYESENEIGQLADALRGTTKNLSDYVNEISAILQRMATGDLTEDSDEITDFLGDFASIKESFVHIGFFIRRKCGNQRTVIRQGRRTGYTGKKIQTGCIVKISRLRQTAKPGYFLFYLIFMSFVFCVNTTVITVVCIYLSIFFLFVISSVTQPRTAAKRRSP